MLGDVERGQRQAPLDLYKMVYYKEKDVVSVHLNYDERRWLDTLKKHYGEEKDSTMLKKLAFSDIVILDELVRR